MRRNCPTFPDAKSQSLNFSFPASSAPIADMSSAQESALAKFRALHQSGCFVLPNPWDIGTAIYLHQLGFKALATTSAGFAFSRGLSDGKVLLGEMIAHIREIVAATPLPVNADFLSAFADEPEAVTANVKLCVATGVAGLSIEDNTGRTDVPLYKESLAVERVRSARRAIDDSGTPVVLTARCEAWLVEQPDPLRTALKRLVAFAEAGADCLYAPGVSDPGEIAEIVKAVSPKPVNILVSRLGCTLSVSQLAELGVRRISVGSALATTAWGAFMRAAKEIATKGTFNAFADSAPFGEINALFANRS
jgi:2-methylisocitrate lyase-like PEP mutase family enzyme